MNMLNPSNSLWCLFTAIPIFAAETRSSESGRPRGVGPEFAKYYKSPSDFACISNPSQRISLSQINDDYCDCPDGSDEPGTAACSYIAPYTPEIPIGLSVDQRKNITLSLPGFYCKNKGHIPSYTPFTRVNDGRCDYDTCCDGSDEWQGVGGVSCPDKCKEIGKEWRRKDELRKKAMGQATKKKREMIAEASKLRQELITKISTLQTEIESRERKVQEAEKELEAAEKQEKLRVVKAPTGKSVLSSLAKERVEELRAWLTDVRQQRDSQRARVEELEGILKSIKTDYNPNFNDQAVKKGLDAWDNYAAKESEGWGAAEDRDLDEILKEDGADSGINWAEWEASESKETESDVDSLYQLSAYLPASVRIWIQEQIASLRALLVENGMLAPKPSSDGTVPESPELTAAKNAANSARNDLSSSQNSLRDSQNDLEKDYGLDDIFRALKGQCVSGDVGEYTYSHCYMDRTKQKPKHGGGETNMGNFVRFDREFVDEEEDAEGKGIGSGERIIMRYENGQGCWNGPSRSTKVILGCGPEEEIWKVSETEKCVYEIHQGTAAVCDTQGVKKKETKDEL
ncbi:MAG: hypothetical protein Q9227_002865 [Pyrenula ochraceoflavens]